jgi:hypothetical protein
LPYPQKSKSTVLPLTLADLTKIGDTIKSDTIKPKKAILEGKIKYKAEQYTKLDQQKKADYAL